MDLSDLLTAVGERTIECGPRRALACDMTPGGGECRRQIHQTHPAPTRGWSCTNLSASIRRLVPIAF